jgi:hypothetical protein
MNEPLPAFLEELIPKFLSSMSSHPLNNPVKSKDIEEGLTKMVRKFYPDKNISGSHVRQLVRHLRRKGYPIGSGSNGYYWAQNQEEWNEGIKNLRSRALDLLKTYQEARKIKIELNLFNQPNEETKNTEASTGV